MRTKGKAPKPKSKMTPGKEKVAVSKPLKKAKFKFTSKSKGKGVISKEIHKPAVSSETGKNFYAVEKILEKKVKNGNIYFLIKWENWDSESNTWEPIEHIPANMIEEYEQELKSAAEGQQIPVDQNPKKSRITNVMANTMRVTRNLNRNNDKHRVPYAVTVKNRIVSTVKTVVFRSKDDSKDKKGKLIFAVKFEDSADLEAVHSKDAYKYFPGEVIKYYETLVSFH